ncbi:symporter [Shigella flexneri]
MVVVVAAAALAGTAINSKSGKKVLVGLVMGVVFGLALHPLWF